MAETLTGKAFSVDGVAEVILADPAQQKAHKKNSAS